MNSDNQLPKLTAYQVSSSPPDADGKNPVEKLSFELFKTTQNLVFQMLFGVKSPNPLYS